MLEYIDVENYKNNLLAEERIRTRSVQRRLAAEKRQRKKEGLISKGIRLIGVLMILISIVLAFTLFKGEDGTILFFAAAIGIFLTFKGLGSRLAFIIGKRKNRKATERKSYENHTIQNKRKGIYI